MLILLLLCCIASYFRHTYAQQSAGPSVDEGKAGSKPPSPEVAAGSDTFQETPSAGDFEGEGDERFPGEHVATDTDESAAEQGGRERGGDGEESEDEAAPLLRSSASSLLRAGMPAGTSSAQRDRYR